MHGTGFTHDEAAFGLQISNDRIYGTMMEIIIATRF